MIYQPSNVTPSTFTENYTINAKDTINISWQVNGNSPLNYTQLFFYDSNGICFNLTEIGGVEKDLFYGTDEFGNPVMFNYAPNKTWSELGISNGNEYSFQIAQFYGEKSTSNYVISEYNNQKNGAIEQGKNYYYSYDGKYYVFTAPIDREDYTIVYQGNNIIMVLNYVYQTNYTANNIKNHFAYFTSCSIQNKVPKGATFLRRTSGEISVANATISTTNYYFYARNPFNITEDNKDEMNIGTLHTFEKRFSLADNEAINARWQLHKGDELVDDTGVISTGKLEYYYGAFENDTYSLTLTIQNQYGQTASYKSTFTVQYDVQIDDEFSTLTCHSDYAELEFKTVKPVNINPTTSGGEQLTENGLLLNTNDYIRYEDIVIGNTTQTGLDFDPQFSILYKAKNFPINIFKTIQDTTDTSYKRQDIHNDILLETRDNEVAVYNFVENEHLIHLTLDENIDKAKYLYWEHFEDYSFILIPRYEATSAIEKKIKIKRVGEPEEELPRPTFSISSYDQFFEPHDIISTGEDEFYSIWKTMDLIDLGETDNTFDILSMNERGQYYKYIGETDTFIQNYYYYLDYSNNGELEINGVNTAPPQTTEGFVYKYTYQGGDWTSDNFSGNHEDSFLDIIEYNGDKWIGVASSERTTFYNITTNTDFFIINGFSVSDLTFNNTYIALCGYWGLYYNTLSDFFSHIGETASISAFANIFLGDKRYHCEFFNHYLITDRGIYNADFSSTKRYYQTFNFDDKYDIVSYLTTLCATNQTWELDNTTYHLLRINSNGLIMPIRITSQKGVVNIRIGSTDIPKILNDLAYDLKITSEGTGTNISKFYITINGVTTEHSISFTSPQIKHVIILGEQLCEYFAIAKGNVSIDNLTINNEYMYGKYTGNDRSLNAGYEIGEVSVSRNGTVYNVDTKRVRDYTINSNNSYVFDTRYLLKKDDEHKIDRKTLSCFKLTYCELIEAQQTDNNVYHLVNLWRFANNIDEGSITNNNNPEFLDNFTRYPYKQPSKQMYRSGTLQSLLSRFCDKYDINGNLIKPNDYEDTAEQMEELFNASLSDNDFFLRDMKGNMYKVAIDSPITQTINNKSYKQEVTISVSWKEIGSCDKISIISAPTDEGWRDEYDEGVVILPKFREVTNEYGIGVEINC